MTLAGEWMELKNTMFSEVRLGKILCFLSYVVSKYIYVHFHTHI